MRNIPIHLIIFVILLAFSGISWVYRQLKAQQAMKQIRDRAEQRQVEVLRTGRDPDSEPLQNSAEALRARELAARREAQLIELRRRAQERARQQSHEADARSTPPTTASAPPTAPLYLPQHVPGSSGLTVPPSVPSRPSPPSQVRVAPRQTARVQSQSQPLPAVRAKAKQSSASKVPAHAAHHEEPLVIKPPPPVVRINAPRTPEEWRRAIIASEIMSPPLSVRQSLPPIPF